MREGVQVYDDISDGREGELLWRGRSDGCGGVFEERIRSNGSSASEPGLNKGFHSSELRPLVSPKRLKSCSPKEVEFKYESIWARSMEGVSRPDVSVECVKDVSLVYGVKRKELSSSSKSSTRHSSKSFFIARSESDVLGRG